MDQAQLPKIRNNEDIEEQPFRVVGVTEKILQGWDPRIKRTRYLFWNENKWCYFDKDTNQIIPVIQWKGKAAFIEGGWVKMTLYHRLHVIFANVVSFKSYDRVAKQNLENFTQEAIITVTDSCYKTLAEVSAGRPEGSWYKLGIMRKSGKRTVIYADRFIFVQ